MSQKDGTDIHVLTFHLARQARLSAYLGMRIVPTIPMANDEDGLGPIGRCLSVIVGKVVRCHGRLFYWKCW